MCRLEIRLFGVMFVSLNGQPVTTFESNKVRALLAYLATERGPHPREQLAELFWPERAEGSARNNLRHALAILRQAILDQSAEPPSLLITSQTIEFNPAADAWADVAVFAAGADGDIAKLEAQLALYRGPFLANVTIRDSAPLEDWLQLKREQFQDQVADRLRRLAEHYEERGPFEIGLEYTRRRLEITPWQEDAHRQLMRLLALDGRRSEALLQYEACRRALADELDVEPDEETNQLVAQIRAGSFPGRTPGRRQSIRGYELRRPIGAGGFGEVYRAYQPALDRDVAIKVILPQFANLPEFIQRFETEAQLIARLEHPHIVPLCDYWREPGRAFLVMRWLRGGNLADSLRAGAWSIPAAAQLLAQIAGALNVAHQQGIVHRDVRPANILLDEECNAYLSDFGIAKGPLQTASQTYDYSSDGSPDYSSPEQAQRQPLSPLSDLFSLGLVMYEVLTGAHPFAELSPDEQISRRLAGNLPRIIERRPELPESLQRVLEQATAAEPAARFPDVQSFAEAFREAVTPATAALLQTPDWTLTEPVNPYKGLRAFDEADAPDFFGRDALTKAPLARLEHRFLAVVGPSGCGKSSVVRAGMLPAIRQGALPGADQWRIVKMFPGDHPLDELEIGLLRVAVSQPADLAEQLRRDERGLLRVVQLIMPEEEPAVLQPAELLLVIDQFEELYTHTVDRSEREHLLELLHCAVTATRSAVRVIITLRADFYDRPLLHSSFSRLLQNHTAVVLPLTSAELAEAIEKPAHRAGVSFEPGLAATIVADVKEQPGALPMLQYALMELFEQREGHILTDAAYAAMGGVAGALGRRAEAIYATLDAAQQPAARQAFLRLVSPGEAAGDSGITPDTRRRVRLSELTALGAAQQAAGDEQPDSAPPNPIPEVIELFGQHRLLTFDRDPANREPTVEVSHEALLYEWARLRQWLEETRDDLRLQRLLAGAAAEWLGSGQNAGFLLRGSRLDQFADWARTSDLVLTDTEQAYLDASLAARAARQSEDALRVAHEQGLERRSRRFLRALAVVFAVAAVAALALSYFALRQRRSALEAYSLSLGANAQRALDEQDTVTALALALAANEIDDPPAEAQRVLMNAAYAPGPRKRYQVEEMFPGVTGPATALAASPTNGTILVGLADGSLIVWQPQTEEEIFRLQGHTGAVNDIAISADGLRAVSGADDAQVIVWDLETGQALHRLTGHSGAVLTVDISPDGSRFLSGGVGGDSVENPGELILWDAETGAEIRRFEDIPKAVMAAAFALEGSVILAGSGDPEYVTSAGGEGPSGALVYQHTWDVESGQPLDKLAGLESDTLSLAVSPDGSSALIGSFYDGTVVHWDLVTGEPIRTLAAHDDAVRSVAFAADGNRALSGSADRQLLLWDLNTGEVINRFAAHDEAILAAALSADGRFALFQRA